MKQWCCFKIEQRNGRETKLPINAYNGNYGKSNDENTWSDYDTAIEAIDKFNLDGLGFYFKAPYFGIDIDDVRQDIDRYKNDDTDDNLVSEFVDTLGSYAEISVSGNGIHIIAKGELPKNGSRKGNIEMYSTGRFFVMTGDRLGNYHSIMDDSDYGRINYLHSKYIASSQVTSKRSSNTDYGNGLSEEEVINAALNSKNGVRFKLFMNGGWEQFYDSQSEADMAFSNDLAFWTNRDFTKMDNIFRESSLYRDKYDSKRNDSTYGAETLNKAIQECINVFNPTHHDDGFNLYIADQDTKKVERKFYSYDDTGNAQRFTDNYSDAVRYSHTRKSWYFYNGKTWEVDQAGKVKKLVDDVLEKMKKEPVFTSKEVDEEDAQKNLQKHLKYSRGSNAKASMLRESQHLLPVSVDQFDKDTNLLNVQNGYLNLKKGELLDHDRDNYFTRISNVEFTDKADCPMWDSFLLEIFDDDTELIEYIQRAVGYSLGGSTEEQMMFILYGNGRNGKSVFLDIINELFGSYSTNIQPQSIMIKQQSNNANPDIAKLDGARFVTTTEPSDGMRFDEGLVKQMTGGDKITARFLHENEFEYIPQFKLWMATNHKPIIRGTDDGIWRRMAVIPFTVQIPLEKVDKHLTNKLKGELSAILNWAVEGHLMWQKHGLKEPVTIKEQRRTYRTEMDSIEAFIEECCEKGSNFRVRGSQLFEEYDYWAKENNQYRMTNTKFGREISKKFTKFLSAGVWYKGLKVKEGQEKPFFKMNH